MLCIAVQFLLQQMNAALVSIRDFFQIPLKNFLPQTFNR